MRIKIQLLEFMLIAFSAALITSCKATDSAQVDNLLNGSVTQPSTAPVQLLASSSASYGQVGVCVGPISVSTVSASLMPVATKTAVTVGVSVNGSGTYFEDSSCVSPTNAVTIPAGASTGNVYFKGSGAGFGMLYFSAAGFISGMMPFNVVSGAPASVGMGGPITVGQGSCSSPFTLTLYDANGFTATASTAVTIQLAGAGSGNFYADASCSSAVTQVTISSGSSTKYIYVKDNVSEALSLSATATGLGGATTPLTVTSGATASRLMLSALQPYTAAGACYGPLTATTTDSSGMPISVPSSVTVSLASSGSGSFYSDAACTTQVTSLSIASGTSSGTFYFKGTLVQSSSMFATSTGLSGGTMAYTIIAGQPAAISLSGPVSVSGGTCSSAFTATLVDAYGNTATSATPVVLNLAGGGSGAFYADSSCGSAVSSVTVASGTSIKAFYFKDNVSESLTLTANATGLTGANALIAVSSTAGAARLTLSAQQPYSTAGSCFGPISVTLADSNGTPVNASSPTPVSFTSNGTGAFFSNASCSVAASTVTIGSGTSVATIYYKGTLIESYTLFASGTGLTGGSLPLTMIADAPAALSLSGPSSVNKGSCSSAFTVNLLDSYGNSAKASGTVSIGLAGAGSGAFYSDSGCTSSVASVSVNSGTSSKIFYVKDATAEALTLAASSTGLTGANFALTVLPGASASKLLLAAQQLYGSAGSCFGPITISSADSSGASVAVVSSTSVALTTNGVGQFYTDVSCTTQTSATTITAGSSSVAVYYKGTAVQTSSLFASASGLTGGSMTYTVVAGAPASISLTGTTSFSGGACSPAFTVTLLDAYGNTAKSSGTTTINLGGGGAGAFYTSSTCTGGTTTTSVSIANNASSATFYFKDASGESLTLAATDAAASLTAGTLGVTVVAQSVPTKITLSAPATMTSTGVCYGPITISSTDANNAAVAVPSDTVVNLGGNSLGAYYTDATCGTSTATRTISAGGTATTVFFKDNSAENLVLTAGATGLSSGTLAFTIAAGAPAKLTLAGSSSLSASTCSGAFTVTLQDTFNNTAKSSGATTINLSGAGSGAFYSDAACATSTTSVSIANNASSASFYFKDGSAESLTLSVAATGLASATSALTITSGTPIQLALVAPASTSAGLCSGAFTVYSRDADGNNANLASNKTITLSGPGNGKFYSDSGCVVEIPAVVISSGANSTTFWVKNNKAETLTIGASAASLVSASVSYTIAPNALFKLLVLPTASSQNAHACSQAIAITGADVYDNSYTLGSTISVSLSDGGAGGTFYDDAACTAGHTLTAVNLLAGTSTTNVYYANNTAGAVTLSAVKAGLTTGTAAVTVVGLPASKLVITGPTSLTTNTCSSAYTVTSKDAFDSVTTVTAPTTISLGASAGHLGDFYSNSSCTNVITSLSFTAGQSSGQFYYKNISGQATSLEASAGGLTTGSLAITQTANINSLDMMAGGWFLWGTQDGIGSAARFLNPYTVTSDGAGNLYVSDATSIRKLNLSTNALTTIAGKVSPYTTGMADGDGLNAQMISVGQTAILGTDLYFVDSGNHLIRKMSLNSPYTVTTIAGQTGVFSPFSNGVGSAARFYNPTGIATDGTNLYVAEYNNHCLRKIVIGAGPTYTVSTLAGSCGNSGAVNSSTDATAVRFLNPRQLVYLGGYLYVTDALNHLIRKVEVATGYTSTLAGTAGTYGNTNATGTSASFNQPYGIATDGTNLYVSEWNNNNVRQVTLAGVVTNLAGSYTSGWGDGYGTSVGVKFGSNVGGLAYYAGTNSLYLADTTNYVIRRIDLGNSANVTTIAGAPGSMLTKRAPYTNTVYDGTGSGAALYNNYGAVEVNGILYFTEVTNNTIRSLNPKTQVVTTVAGLQSNTGAFQNGIGTSARFSAPMGLAADPTGTYIYIADQANHCIRRMEVATANVTTFAGACGTSGHVDTLVAANMRLNSPRDIVIDPSGNHMFITEAHRIRKIYITGANAGGGTVIAGDPTAATTGSTNALGTAARFSTPAGLAMDATGTYLYTMEFANHTLRRVQISNGDTTTLAGLAGSYNQYVDSAVGSSVRFSTPYGLTISPDGSTLYIADRDNNAIRKYVISGAGAGVTSTFLGGGSRAINGEFEDGSLTQTTGVRNVLYTSTGLWVIQDRGIRLVH